MTPITRPAHRRTRIQERNEHKILQAALDVFSRHGFRGATLDQIALAAGLPKANLLYYFKNKKTIYVRVMQQTLEDWLDPLTELDPNGDPREEIRKYITVKLDMSRRNPKASCLFANEVLHGAPMIADELSGPLKDLVDQKAAVIRQWIKKGHLRAVDPYHLIFMIWATTQHYADFASQIHLVLGKGKSEAVLFRDAEETLLAVIFDGLMPR